MRPAVARAMPVAENTVPSLMNAPAPLMITGTVSARTVTPSWAISWPRVFKVAPTLKLEVIWPMAVPAELRIMPALFTVISPRFSKSLESTRMAPPKRLQLAWPPAKSSSW